jgi:pyruvate carboxylase
LGLADQRAVGLPRGFAVQSRIVAQGVGTLTAYKEPSGPGVRGDACGYLGYAPPPQFDPLLAKLIGQSNSSGTFESAVDRSLRALAEFHIAGLPTNGATARDSVRCDVSCRRCAHVAARQTPALMQPADAVSGTRTTLALLDQQAATVGGGNSAKRSTAPAVPQLSVENGHQGVESPMAEPARVSVAQGAVVRRRDARDHYCDEDETAVTAPCAGTVTQLQRLSVGDAVATGQVIAVIAPAQTNGAIARVAPER